MTTRTKPLPRRGDEMDLPPTKTCSDCVHFRRCNSMFGHIATDESCDWSPSRFYPIPEEEPPLQEIATELGAGGGVVVVDL